MLPPASLQRRSSFALAFTFTFAMLACACGDSSADREGASGPDPRSSPNGEPNAVGSVSFADAACTKDQWCWVEPLPQGNPLRSVWAAGPNDIWAVGWRGIIAHRNASNWGALFFEGESKENFVQVRGSSADDVWIVGDGGDTKTGILHSDGKSLTRAFIKDPKDPSKSRALAFTAVWPFGPTDVWAVGGGGLWHFDGRDWMDVWSKLPSMTKGASGFGIHDIWASGPNDLWLVGQIPIGGSPLQFLRYDGSTWRVDASSVRTGDAEADATVRIRGSGPTDVWITAGTRDADKMFHWDGEEWAPFAGLSATDRYDGLEVRGPGDAFVLESGRLLHNDGHKWTVAAEAPQASAWGYALAAIPGDGAIEAVGDGGLCARWKDGWKVEVTPSSASQVLDVGSGEVYVADQWPTSPTTSHVRVRRGDGTAWTTILDIDEPQVLEGVALRGTSPNNVWLAELGPAIGEAPVNRYDGATWAKLPTMPFSSEADAATSDLWVESAGRALLVGRGRSAWFANGKWGDVLECGFATVAWGAGKTVLVSGASQIFQLDPTEATVVLEQSGDPDVTAWGTSETDRWLLIDGVPHRWPAAGPLEVALPGGDKAEDATWFMGASADDTWVGTARTVRHWEGSAWGKAEDIGAAPQPKFFGPRATSESPGLYHHKPLSAARVGKSRFIATRSGLVARREP